MRFRKGARRSVAQLAIATALALSGCAGQPAEERALYERLGGHERMDFVVDLLIDRLATEPDTRRTFAGLNLADAKKSVSFQFCSVSGGGSLCERGTMSNARDGLDLAGARPDRLIAILRQELWNAGIEEGPAEELIDLLRPMGSMGQGSALVEAGAPRSAQ